MRFRSAPAAATWLLQFFCSSPENEAMIGDLLEQYQNGRSPFWYWRQVLVMVFLGLCRRRRMPALSANWGWLRQGLAVTLFLAVILAVLLSNISPILLAGVFVGVVAGILRFLSSGQAHRGRSDAPAARIYPDRTESAVARHPGISISHIPVEGAVGLLFVIATASVFAGGIPAIRELLVLVAPLGIAGSGLLLYWHKRHPLKLQTLNLQRAKRPSSAADAEPS